MKEEGMAPLARISRLIGFLSIIVASNHADLASGYPVVSQECKSDPIACAIDGKLSAVSIYGEIGSDDSKFFEDIDKAIPSDQPFPQVYVNSEGGSMRDAMTIGRILRKRNGSVESGSPFLKYDFIECSSACVIVAAGATHRLLNHIGIHQGHYDRYKGPKEWSATPVSDSDADEHLKYYDEMGIDPSIKEIIKRTPFNDMYNVYYDPTEDYKDQQITKLGFHMENRAALGTIGHPTQDEMWHSEDHKYWEVINYGSNRAISYFVTAILRTHAPFNPDYELANKALQVGVDRNDLPSMHNLAYHLLYGKGAKKNEKKSTELYLKAARLGNPYSQNNVGWAYYKGIGVKRNIPEAVFWTTRAADQGVSFAYGTLCEMYDGGDVFKPNNVEAYKWCRLAVATEAEGHARANDVKILVRFRKKMSQAEIDEGEVLFKSWRPLKGVTTQMGDTDDG
jgi:TPR repeat protein